MNEAGIIFCLMTVQHEYGSFPPALRDNVARSQDKAKGAAQFSRCPFLLSPDKRNGGRNMLTQTQARISEMRNADIRTVDKNALPDMSDYKFDKTLSQTERAKLICKATINPYMFRLDDMVVKVEFADKGPTLQDLIGAFMLRQKCGLQ